MSEKNSASSGGIGVIGLLGVAFVVLKLCGVIDWSWWWVTAPFWGGFAAVLAILAVAGVLWLVGHALESKEARARRQAVERLRDLGNRLSRR